MDDPFATIGSVVVASLKGKAWTNARLSAWIVEPGVVQRTQGYVERPGTPEREFRLIDPMKVMDALESHQAMTIDQGHPRWTGIVFRLEASGEFKVEYSYEPPPPL